MHACMCVFLSVRVYVRVIMSTYLCEQAACQELRCISVVLPVEAVAQQRLTSTPRATCWRSAKDPFAVTETLLVPGCV